MALPGVPVVRERLERLRAEIAQRGHRDVKIVAVTKAHPAELIQHAVEAGCDAIGENYAQELRDKTPTLTDLGQWRPTVHFIGRLQTNKVRQLTAIVDVWESVDRAALIDELAKRTPAARILLQVNATDEPLKGGCSPADVPALHDHASGRGLLVEGLMTVGPTTGGPSAARPAFRAVTRLADELGLQTRSMGMTGDYHVALDEGATEIRVGSLLFGTRPPA